MRKLFKFILVVGLLCSGFVGIIAGLFLIGIFSSGTPKR